MRHRKSGVKLSRTSSHRKAMFRNMVTSLFKYESIRTTDAKAKELRKWADNVITLAKRGDLHARRQALSIIPEKNVVHKLFEEATDRFGAISGGYTRITKLGLRAGDAASMSMIELINHDGTSPKKKTKSTEAKPEVKDEKPVETVTEEKTEEPVTEAKAEEAVADDAEEENTSETKENTAEEDKSEDTEKPE